MSEPHLFIPSATVVLLQKTSSSFKVLLLQRNSKIAFHGGSWVFPGGKIDPEDHKIALGDSKSEMLFADLEKHEQLRIARQAAIRETHEEAGLNLALDGLFHLSNWYTPDTLKKRFDAWFFIGVLDNSNDTVQVDNGEICAYQWLTPVEALNKQKNGEISLPPPTYVTLSLLSDCKSIDEVLRHTDDSPKVFRPRIAAHEGGFCSVYEDDTAYESLDLDKPGKRHRLYVRDGRFDYINE